MTAPPAAAATRPSLPELQDPFWNGFSAGASYSIRRNSDYDNSFSQFQAGYGWENGAALEVSVPVLWANDPSSVAGASTPRIGGGASGRIQVDGLFRVWGDAYDYVAVDLGAGLPFQSDAAVADSAAASWLLPVTLFGRWDLSWIALLPSLTDAVTLPTVIDRPSGKWYYDASNSVSASLTAASYPLRGFSPSLTYTEQFPSSSTLGIDQINAFIVSAGHTGRVRTVTGALSWNPFSSNWVLTAQARWLVLYPAAAYSPWQWVASARWVF